MLPRPHSDANRLAGFTLAAIAPEPVLAALRAAGASVRTAESARALLVAVTRQQPRAVVLADSVHLPFIPGLKAAAHGLLVLWVGPESSRREAEMLGALPCVPDEAVTVLCAAVVAAPPTCRRVLVVEDTASVRETIRLQTRGLPYEVLFAADGREAVSLLRTIGVALVLADLNMPIMDGYELAAAIRADALAAPDGRRLPIVAVSADASPDIRRRVAALGMDDMLPKPFTKASLRDVIERWAA